MRSTTEKLKAAIAWYEYQMAGVEHFQPVVGTGAPTPEKQRESLTYVRKYNQEKLQFARQALEDWEAYPEHDLFDRVQSVIDVVVGPMMPSAIRTSGTGSKTNQSAD